MNKAVRISVKNFSEKLIKELSLENERLFSPLGLWLIEGYYGANLKNLSSRNKLEEHLGIDLTLARTFIEELIKEIPSEYLNINVNGWKKESLSNTEDSSFDYLDTKNLDIVENTKQLDDWAKDNSLGLIEDFGMSEDALSVIDLILASVLAVKMGWESRFDKDSNKMFFSSLLENGILNAGTMLTTSGVAGIFTPATTFDSNDEFSRRTFRNEVSVTHIVLPETCSIDKQWVSVFEILERLYGKNESLVVPENSGHSWEVTDREIYLNSREAADRNKPIFEAFSREWEASGDYDFTEESGARLFAGGNDLVVKQTVVGDYNREGFSAAALTKMLLVRGIRMELEKIKVPVVTFDYCKPHFVAVMSNNPLLKGLPLFVGRVDLD